ncbi:MAG: D-alanyl-D-alanine carboxypeptidase/D-alanyl-D-alanine-endopeptidase [Kofleriaceae bacterium]
MRASRGSRSGWLVTVAGVLAAATVGSIDPAPARSQAEPGAVALERATDAGPGDEPADAAPADDEGEAGDDSAEPATPQGDLPADPAERLRWLQGELREQLADRPSLRSARVGIEVVDVATGERLWSHDPDGRYNLASNTKVITAAAALASLGPDYRWRTSVLAMPAAFSQRTGVVDGDLYVRGRGDPTLEGDDLAGLARDLRVLGVRKVTGGLILDRSYFDGADVPPHFDEQPRERAGFRASVGALSVSRNAAVIVVEPDPTGAGAARVRLVPDAPEAVRLVRAEVITVSRGRTHVRIVSAAKRDHVEVSVTGQLNVDDGIYYGRQRVDDPAAMAMEVLRRALVDEGIRIGRRGFQVAPTPVGARALAEHDSAELAVVLRTMNKHSDNFYAETVLKTLGAEARGAPEATWADGVAAVRAYLTGCGVDLAGLRIDNGSGLFSSTEVSPAQLVATLRCAARDFRVAPELMSSLAVAGIDGTMRRRLRGDATVGRVRAKTGTLATVTTLTGYAGVDGGRLAAFAVLVNDAGSATRRDARSLQDAIAATLVAYAAP